MSNSPGQDGSFPSTAGGLKDPSVRNGTGRHRLEVEPAVRDELLELYVIFQARVLHVRDASGWRHVFDKSVQRLLSIKPLQSLTKRGRLAVVMFIVRGGRTDLIAPTVLAVLACDWANDEWEPFKLLQAAVRQSALSGLRSKIGSAEVASRRWSRRRIASMLEDGVESTVADFWRGLGIEGAAREQVKKTGRELRGLAARCRGASDRYRARELLSSYLESNRLESFVQALVVWGREHLTASKSTIFDTAFPFLEATHVQPPRASAGRLDSDTMGLDDDHAQGGFECLEEMDERGRGGTAFPISPVRNERSQSVSVPSTAEDGGRRCSRLGRGCSWDDSAADGDANNTDTGSRLSHTLPQGVSDMYQAESQAVSPLSRGEAVQGRGIHDHARVATFGGVKPGMERRRLGILRAEEKVFLRMDTSRESKQWRFGAVAAVRGDGTYDVRYDNGEVDRLVRRADIFKATTSGDRAPHGSMELGHESGGDGVDVARNGPGDLCSRQNKRQRRKLVRLADSPPLSPDAQPVWEERTPPRPALFQDEPWSTADADVGSDTPSSMLAGTKEESTTVRRWHERGNKKRKTIFDQDGTTSDDCDETLPVPLPVPLPTTECLPADIIDFVTEKCDIEPPHRVNEVEVIGDDGGGGCHREALQTPDSPNLGRVEVRELEDPENGFIEDGLIEGTANPKNRPGVDGMGADYSAVSLEAGHSARLDNINAQHGTRVRAGGGDGGEDEEEQVQDDEVETDEELAGGARGKGAWNREEQGEEEEERVKEKEKAEEEEKRKEEDEEEEEECTDEEFVGTQECGDNGEKDDQKNSIRAAKEGKEEDEYEEVIISRTGEGDASFARRIDTHPFQLRYDSHPSPSPAYESSTLPLQSPPPPPPPPPPAGQTQWPLARNEIPSASDQLSRLYSEDGQQNESQGNSVFVGHPHQEEVLMCHRDGASQPVAEKIRGTYARVDDSSGHPDGRAGAERPNDTRPDFEAPTHDSMVPLINQHMIGTERGRSSCDTTPSATVDDLDHAENSTCREQDKDETSAQQGVEKTPDDFHDVAGVTDGAVGGMVDTQSPSQPSRFIRVYGSAGIVRVRQSVGDWLSQRWPPL